MNTPLLWVNELGFQQATPPKKYPRLPLCTSRLSVNDCYPLIERITSKIQSWQARFLSYAGRVEFIKSVITPLCTYWLKSFVLPKSILCKIKSLFGKFLWEGSTLSKKTHQFSMDRVTKSKIPGGVGIIDVVAWNRGAYYGIIFKILSNKESMWTNWMHAYSIKGKHFWTMPTPQRLFLDSEGAVQEHKIC